VFDTAAKVLASLKPTWIHFGFIALFLIAAPFTAPVFEENVWDDRALFRAGLAAAVATALGLFVGGAVKHGVDSRQAKERARAAVEAAENARVEQQAAAEAQERKNAKERRQDADIHAAFDVLTKAERACIRDRLLGANKHSFAANDSDSGVATLVEKGLLVKHGLVAGTTDRFVYEMPGPAYYILVNQRRHEMYERAYEHRI